MGRNRLEIRRNVPLAAFVGTGCRDPFPFEETDMAKGQKRSSRELRKPKAPKNKISAAPFITTSQAAKKPVMPAKSKS
jgi:hypothetical protein